MTWMRLSDYAIRNENGDTICKSGTADGFLYEVWQSGRMLATRLPSADVAKALVAQQEKR